MTPITPILIHAEFRMINECEARLCIRTNTSPKITVIVLIEAGDHLYLTGNDEDEFAVVDGEVFSIVARHDDGGVIASGVYEVSTDYCKATNTLLVERCACNLDFTQVAAVNHDQSPLSPPLANSGILEADVLAQALTQTVDPCLYAEIGRAHEVIGQLPQPIDQDFEFVRMLENTGARVVTVEGEVAQ